MHEPMYVFKTANWAIIVSIVEQSIGIPTKVFKQPVKFEINRSFLLLSTIIINFKVKKSVLIFNPKIYDLRKIKFTNM